MIRIVRVIEVITKDFCGTTKDSEQSLLDRVEIVGRTIYFQPSRFKIMMGQLKHLRVLDNVRWL